MHLGAEIPVAAASQMPRPPSCPSLPTRPPHHSGNPPPPPPPPPLYPPQIVKLDIDAQEIEAHLMEAIMADPFLRSSIAEMFFEAHFTSVMFGDTGLSWKDVIEQVGGWMGRGEGVGVCAGRG